MLPALSTTGRAGFLNQQNESKSPINKMLFVVDTMVCRDHRLNHYYCRHLCFSYDGR
jgi:hypothetical protein